MNKTDNLVDYTFEIIADTKMRDPVLSLEEIRMDIILNAFLDCTNRDLYNIEEYCKKLLIRDKNLYYTIISCIDEFKQFEFVRPAIIKFAVLL
jgi:hypothetical protein